MGGEQWNNCRTKLECGLTEIIFQRDGEMNMKRYPNPRYINETYSDLPTNDSGEVGWIAQGAHKATAADAEFPGCASVLYKNTDSAALSRVSDT